MGDQDELSVSGAGSDADSRLEVSAGHEDSYETARKLAAELRGEAEAIGLSGKAVVSYIQDGLRDHRLQRREHEKFLIEQKRISEMDEKKFKLERDLAERKMNEELKLKKKELELKEKELEQKEKTKKRDRISHGLPKLPWFDERQDDIESYLDRFERHAESREWPKNEWSGFLYDLLRGKALVYYKELSPEDAKLYEKASAHLLKRFQCTEEGFRKQFRSAKPESEETMPTFLSRMKRYLIRWVALAKVGKDFDKLIDLLLKEQIYFSCSKSLVTKLRESEFDTVEDMIEAAERYREAHPSEEMAFKKTSETVLAGVGLSSGGDSGSQYTDRSGGQRNFQRDMATRGGRGRGGAGQQYRPPQANSYNQTNTNDQRQGAGFRYDQSGSGGSGQKPSFTSRCYWCDEEGHRVRDCPKRKQQQPNRIHATSVCVPSCNGGDSGSRQSTMPQSSSSQNTSVGTAARDVESGRYCNKPHEALQKCTGTVNGKKVDVLLDSGSSIVGVRRSLVKSGQFLKNRVKRLTQFDGGTIELPVAMVDLDTPYYKGWVEACVVDDPVCDVILGRIPGVTYEIGGVMQILNEHNTGGSSLPFNSELRSKSVELSISSEELRGMQEADRTLSDLFTRCELKRVRSADSYVKVGGVLHRKVWDKETMKEYMQVVVPKQLRTVVMGVAHGEGHLGSNVAFRRIFPFCFWPSMKEDIKEYCQNCSCHTVPVCVSSASPSGDTASVCITADEVTRDVQQQSVVTDDGLTRSVGQWVSHSGSRGIGEVRPGVMGPMYYSSGQGLWFAPPLVYMVTPVGPISIPVGGYCTILFFPTLTF